MRKSKYSEEQNIGALKRAEQGVAVKDICRELGISNATFYQWRSKHYSPGSHTRKNAVTVGGYGDRCQIRSGRYL